MNDGEKESLFQKLNGLLFVPRGEVDDTRFEMFYTSLSQYVERGPEVMNDFLSVGALDFLAVSASQYWINLQKAVVHDDNRVVSVGIRLVGRLGSVLKDCRVLNLLHCCLDLGQNVEIEGFLLAREGTR
jgi:hypothetical protein